MLDKQKEERAGRMEDGEVDVEYEDPAAKKSRSKPKVTKTNREIISISRFNTINQPKQSKIKQDRSVTTPAEIRQRLKSKSKETVGHRRCQRGRGPSIDNT